MSRSPSSYVYYTFRRVLDPDVFRKNFAYQDYFIKKFHKGQYSLKMFFRYNRSVDDEKNSPLIIEIGFHLYFLIMKMYPNLALDMDEKYEKRLVNLLSVKESKSSSPSKWLIVNMYYFAKTLLGL